MVDSFEVSFIDEIYHFILRGSEKWKMNSIIYHYFHINVLDGCAEIQDNELFSYTYYYDYYASKFTTRYRYLHISYGKFNIR